MSSGGRPRTAKSRARVHRVESQSAANSRYDDVDTAIRWELGQMLRMFDICPSSVSAPGFSVGFSLGFSLGFSARIQCSDSVSRIQCADSVLGFSARIQCSDSVSRIQCADSVARIQCLDSVLGFSVRFSCSDSVLGFSVRIQCADSVCGFSCSDSVLGFSVRFSVGFSVGFSVLLILTQGQRPKLRAPTTGRKVVTDDFTRILPFLPGLCWVGLLWMRPELATRVGVHGVSGLDSGFLL